MAYKIFLAKSAEKDIKELDYPVKIAVRDQLTYLSNNPLLGNTLKGELSSIRSYHFKYANVDYRIIYEIYDSDLVVEIIMVGSRENIYKKLKRRI